MTLDPRAQATVRLVGGLFVACVVLQRFAVPGLPVALILPVVLAGAGWGLLRGLLELDPRRLGLWLVMSAATATVVLAQTIVFDRAWVSVTSWALFMTVWAPFTLRLVDRRRETFLAVLRVVVATTAALAAACLLMTGSQYAGLAYRDWLAEAVPPALLLDDFVITYPISYGSPIYRSNAWIGLEPSMVSLLLGVGLVAALLVHSRTRVLVLLLAGMVAATSGSGFAIVVVALIVLVLSPARRVLRPHLAVASVVLVVSLASPMGRSILARLGEGGTQYSSTDLRTIAPYQYLWPSWISDLGGVLFGWGAGASQQAAEESGILGLLVPTPVKIFFDYGLLAGACVAAMIVVCYWGGHSRALGISLLVSLWTLQPGTTTMLVVMPVLFLVTWWSPRAERRALEEALGRPPGDARAVRRSTRREPVTTLAHHTTARGTP